MKEITGEEKLLKCSPVNLARIETRINIWLVGRDEVRYVGTGSLLDLLCVQRVNI